MKIKLIFGVYLFVVGFTFFQLAEDAAPTTIDDFFLPGSQPGESGNLENPNKCDNCHGGYDAEVEPDFLWSGSMMSQAARDPLFFAAMTIANQDAPGSGDLCLRCHTPKGWLEGRSIPTDGSNLTSADMQGVTCDFCHKMVKPTPLGVNPFPNDGTYTSSTYTQDQNYLATISNIPNASANGMYIADTDNAKRGPFSDADATHQFIYSPFHSTSDMCGTCHDVSNPVFSKFTNESGNVDYEPNSFGAPAPDFDPYSMLPIERTFSEWKMSAYNSSEGVYSEAFGGNLVNVSSCQDCHMRDTTGYGCNKNPPLRSNLPMHDMTGGNTFIPKVLYSLFSDDVDTNALNAGIERARYMLQHAATMEMTVDGVNDEVAVKVINETGHKLPSGYPEGRRIWINLKAWGPNGEIYESGHYDDETAVLTHDADVKIYETKPGITPQLATTLNLTSGPSFHFVLNDTIYKDNRIPPRGFSNANFEMIQSKPIGYSYADGQYWDETYYSLPFTPLAVRASLYYQTASKDYIEFLRDENITDSRGQVLYDLWLNHGKSKPELMNQLDWGEPIIDIDQDGYISAVDCDDDNILIYPGAPESWDCLDNDCDGWTDEDFTSVVDLVWTGCNEDDDWNNSSNWNANTIPQSDHNIIIPTTMQGTYYPSITAIITVQSITLEEGAYLYIDAGAEVNTQIFHALPGSVAEVEGILNIIK